MGNKIKVAIFIRFDTSINNNNIPKPNQTRGKTFSVCFEDYRFRLRSGFPN